MRAQRIACGTWRAKRDSRCWWFQLFDTHSPRSHAVKWKTFISTFIKVILFYTKSPFFLPDLCCELHKKRSRRRRRTSRNCWGGLGWGRGGWGRAGETIQGIRETTPQRLISAIYIFTKSRVEQLSFITASYETTEGMHKYIDSKSAGSSTWKSPNGTTGGGGLPVSPLQPL